jgi:hypothetical protein
VLGDNFGGIQADWVEISVFELCLVMTHTPELKEKSFVDREMNNIILRIPWGPKKGLRFSTANF